MRPILTKYYNYRFERKLKKYSTVIKPEHIFDFPSVVRYILYFALQYKNNVQGNLSLCSK